MRVRPLINQGNLHKITKQPIFQIRSKLSHPRPPTAKSLKNIDLLTVELDACLQVLQDVLQGEGRCERDLCDRLMRLLLQLRVQSTGGQDAPDRNSEDREFTPQLIRKSSSKCTLRGKYEVMEDYRFVEGGLVNQRMVEKGGGLCGQLRKARGTKLKLGKENVERYPVSLQIKLQRLTCKLQQSQRVGVELREQVRRLLERIDQTQRGERQACEQKERMEKAGRELGQKLSAALGRIIQVESDLGFRLIEAEHRIEELMTERSVIEGRLQQREKEIMAMWQLSL